MDHLPEKGLEPPAEDVFKLPQRTQNSHAEAHREHSSNAVFAFNYLVDPPHPTLTSCLCSVARHPEGHRHTDKHMGECTTILLTISYSHDLFPRYMIHSFSLLVIWITSSLSRNWHTTCVGWYQIWVIAAPYWPFMGTTDYFVSALLAYKCQTTDSYYRTISQQPSPYS